MEKMKSAVHTEVDGMTVEEFAAAHKLTKEQVRTLVAVEVVDGNDTMAEIYWQCRVGDYEQPDPHATTPTIALLLDVPVRTARSRLNTLRERGLLRSDHYVASNNAHLWSVDHTVPESLGALGASMFSHADLCRAGVSDSGPPGELVGMRDD